MSTASVDPTVRALLKAYLDSVALAEPLQGRIWAASQLTLTQVRALRRLAKGPRSLGELGRELGMSAPSVTRIVDRLEERGLLERRHDPSDRRRVVAAILPAGLRMVTSIPLLERSAIRKAAEALPAADRTRIAQAFEAFANAVRELEQEPQAGSAPVRKRPTHPRHAPERRSRGSRHALA